jgi:anti-sigma factor RsiW
VSAGVELTCRQLVELVTDYLEGRLPPRQHSLFEEHVATCEWCATYLDQMRQTLRALGTLTEESISPGARDALLDAFRDWSAA